MAEDIRLVHILHLLETV